MEKIYLKHSKDGLFIVFDNIGVALHLKNGLEWQEAMKVTRFPWSN